jgi:hypothetical protein
MIKDQHGFYHAIPLQAGSIALRINVENLGEHKLLPFLHVFGRLYHGTINKIYFNQLFQKRKQQFLEQLNAPTTATEKFSDFRLRMTRLALTTEWKWPACVNMIDNEPEWATGGGRILASGLVKKNPEQQLTALFFDQADSDIAQWIDNPVEVTSDQQLHTVLGIAYNPEQSPAIQLSAVLKQINNRTCLLLHGIIDEELEGYQNSQESTDLVTLTKLQQWKISYPRPQLEIYTDWPELISDSLAVWDYRIAGNISHLATQLFLPGHLERLARNHYGAENKQHVLYVKHPRNIDLSEFLIWVDLDHTTFIDQDWDFVLYRPDSNYTSKMIGFSSVLK